MENTISLEKIAKFISKAAKKQEAALDKDKIDSMRKAREAIENFDIDEKATYTFTIGELNAYMG